MSQCIYSFKNDYSMGMHPSILRSIQEANTNQTEAYGLDCYSEQASKFISNWIGIKSADIHFVATGTQANLITLTSFLRPHESVIAATTGHIAVHEAGAIEAVGHKINTVDTPDGKLTLDYIKSILEAHGNDEHMVKPKLVYISNPTELGTVYKKNEFLELATFCKKNDLYFYLDGARLGYALQSKLNDLSIQEMAQHLDALYIGGAKNGAMLGEAIVLLNDFVKKDFRYMIKQKGGLLSKSRFLGAQFAEFFKEGLYLDIADKGNQKAQQLAREIEQKGFSFYVPPECNMLFPILPNPLVKKLQKQFDFYVYKELDEDHSVIRLVTTWNTDEKQIKAFSSLLDKN